jgi:hypothetical protein
MRFCDKGFYLHANADRAILLMVEVAYLLGIKIIGITLTGK